MQGLIRLRVLGINLVKLISVSLTELLLLSSLLLLDSFSADSDIYFEDAISVPNAVADHPCPTLVHLQYPSKIATLCQLAYCAL